MTISFENYLPPPNWKPTLMCWSNVLPSTSQAIEENMYKTTSMMLCHKSKEEMMAGGESANLSNACMSNKIQCYNLQTISIQRLINNQSKHLEMKLGLV